MSSLAMFLCMELLIAEMVPSTRQYIPRESSCVSQVEKDSKNGKVGSN